MQIRTTQKIAGLTYLRTKTSTPEIGYFLLFLNFACSTQATPNHKACNLGGPCGVARSQQRRYAPDARRAMRHRAVISPEVPAALSALGPPGYAWAGLGCTCLGRLGGVLGRFWAVFSRLQVPVNSAVFRPVLSAFGRIKRQNKTQTAPQVVTYLRTYK